jgi:hypothetical protein
VRAFAVRKQIRHAKHRQFGHDLSVPSHALAAAALAFLQKRSLAEPCIATNRAIPRSASQRYAMPRSAFLFSLLSSG